MLCEITAESWMRMIKRRYSELKALKTFEERFEYLKLEGHVGIDTFGFDRYLNQVFYTSKEWRSLREQIIIRDNGCDLGVEDYDIFGRIIIHHMNPIIQDDILNRSEEIMNPEFLICVSHQTHNALHYGTEPLQRPIFVERSKNDTSPWKREGKR